MILFSLPSVNNLGFFDKIVPKKIELQILLVRIGLLDIANEDWTFDIASGNWAFDIANENWVLMLPMKIGF